MKIIWALFLIKVIFFFYLRLNWKGHIALLVQWLPTFGLKADKFVMSLSPALGKIFCGSTYFDILCKNQFTLCDDNFNYNVRKDCEIVHHHWFNQNTLCDYFLVFPLLLFRNRQPTKVNKRCLNISPNNINALLKVRIC